MKYLVIFFALYFMITPRLANAQTISLNLRADFEKAYKKARAFTNTHQDSAMVWAEKCLDLAKTNAQKYKAYYLRGFNAKKLCMYGTARHDYTQAREYSPDSVSYFRINNNLANTYLAIGNHNLANKLNQQSITFNQKAKEWINLSYAYEVKSNILRKSRNKYAITILQKVIKLRKQYAPKQIGYAYERMANVLATFERYDSAIVYQRLALKHHPIKSPENQVSLHTQLARYLIMGDQPHEAHRYLEQVRNLKKPSMIQVFWENTYGLYWISQGNLTKAQQVFAQCDLLLHNLFHGSSDLVSQRTISGYIKDMYQEILTIKQPSSEVYQIYETRLESAKAYYDQASDKIRLKDSLYQQKLAYQASKGAPRFPWEWFAAALLGLGLGIGWYWKRKAQAMKADLANAQSTPPQLQKAQALLAEDAFIRFIEENIRESLPAEIESMVRYYYQGVSMKKIAQQMNTSFDKVRYRFRNLAQKLKSKSLKAFLEAYQARQNRDEVG